MAKRGTSGLSLLIGVEKPVGMTSHDVVNRCRRIFGERRVGHTGTLDPLASGVLCICVGPATRLDAYLTGHDKTYKMGVQFGTSTETDDSEGAVTKTCPVPEQLYDSVFAAATVQGLVGKGRQIPPVYSAIKVNGKKSYDAARKGTIIELEPRDFEVYDARLNSVLPGSSASDEPLVWNTTMAVSKGTYMRSIARDLGRSLGTAAHVASLQRVVSGGITLEDCATLEQIEENPRCSILDPIRALGVRYAFGNEYADKVNNGSFLPEEALSLNCPLEGDMFSAECCTTSVFPSKLPPQDGEVVAVVVDRRLKALYEYCQSEHRYRSRCVFSIGVERGTGM